MPESMLILITFIVALAIGIFIGKLLYSAKSQSEKSGLEERINGLLNQIEQLKAQFAPVFEEAKNIDADSALNILIQAAMAAQQTGALSVRDSVLLASAISVVRPGTI